MTGEVTSAIVQGGFMTFGRQVLWTWCGWLLLSWIITASVAESGTFADDSAFFLRLFHTHSFCFRMSLKRDFKSKMSPSMCERTQIMCSRVTAVLPAPPRSHVLFPLCWLCSQPGWTTEGDSRPPSGWADPRHGMPAHCSQPWMRGESAYFLQSQSFQDAPAPNNQKVTKRSSQKILRKTKH